MMLVHFENMVLTFLFCGSFFAGVYGQCSLPSILQNTVWIDSNKGELVFDTTNMTGWDLDFDGNTGDPLTHWQCFYTETDGSKLYLIFQLTETIEILADEFNVFMCMELTQVTDTSFYYYLLWSDTPPRFNYDRIAGRDVNETITDPRSELCLDANNPDHAAVYPNTGEYHVLLKQGSVISATQECPDSYFGVYTYTITDIDTNTESCGNTYDKLDVCTDYTTMAFNNSLCNTSIAYTENGSLACLVSLTSGDYTYHTAYNQDDTVDEISTFRFTCFVSSLASDGSLQVSQTMGSCKKDQTPDTQPVFPTGTVAGLNIQLSPNRLCPKTDEESEESGLSTGAIIGITFGAILFIVALIVLVCICIRCRQPSKENEKETIENKSAVNSPREDPHASERHTNMSEIDGNNTHLIPRSGDDSFVASEVSNTNRRSPNNEPMLDNITTYNDEAMLDNIPVTTYNEDPVEVLYTGDRLKDLEIDPNTEEKHPDITNDANDDIEVTRVLKTETVSNNGVLLLNSTENLFSGYDPAMVYKSSFTPKSKSEVTLYPECIDVAEELKPSKPPIQTFEYTRDDSGINLKSQNKIDTEQESKLSVKAMHKSESNIRNISKIEKNNRKSSLVSGLLNDSFEWNFLYCSPYALTMEQKQAALDRKIKLQRRRRRAQVRKREELEARRRENIAAFEKWKKEKAEQARK